MNTLEKIKKPAVAASMAIAVSGAALLGAWAQTRNDGEKHSGLRSTIAFVSSRHDPAADPAVDVRLFHLQVPPMVLITLEVMVEFCT